MFTSSISAPYTAVIFSSVRPVDAPYDGYSEMAQRMEDLAKEQEGYLGIESARDPHTGFGITVSYWKDEDSAQAWKYVHEHAVAQTLGKERWYKEYSVQVATVTRSYNSSNS